MNAPTRNGSAGSRAARNLRWLLADLVDEVPGVRSVAVVSSDGLLLLSSVPESAAAVQAPAVHAEPTTVELYAGPETDAETDTDADTHAAAGGSPQGPRGAAADLATVVSGVGSLTGGASRLLGTGSVKQTMVSMEGGSLFVMSISDGSLLGVHAAPDCDMSVVAYHMALFVGRAGHVLTPELRTELRKSMELESKK